MKIGHLNFQKKVGLSLRLTQASTEARSFREYVEMKK